MATAYQVLLYDAWGTRVAVLDAVETLTYTLTANATGALSLTIPADSVPDQYLVGDARLEVWRRPDGGGWANDGNTIWLIEKAVRGISQRDGRYRKIAAVSAMDLLSRRCVMYYDGNAATSKTGPVDNVMRAVFRENLGSSADSSPIYSAGSSPSRNWSSTITVGADASLGPSVSKSFTWRNVLTVMQELARDAANSNAPVYFDIVSLSPGQMEFRTYARVRGVDLTTAGSSVVISAERGSLGGTIELATDWADSATWVVAGGQGQGVARSLNHTFDFARAAATPWGVREVFVDQTALTSSASLLAEASAELRRRRPTRTITGSLLSVPGAIYGVDWSWGDLLKVEFERESFTARVDSVTVTLDNGEETIKAAIKAEAIG